MGNFYKTVMTPVGKLTLIADEESLLAVLWEKEPLDRVGIERGTKSSVHPILLETERQLGEYFAGKRTEFELPLRTEGTDFQQEVWNALRKIPFGRTRSYTELAQAVRRPRAHRAVGSANGRNPLSIVVPCHRVVAKSGKLAGFAGGVAVKARLLELERGARKNG